MAPGSRSSSISGRSKNQRGDVIGATNCFYDITERKLSEQALRRAELESVRVNACELDNCIGETTELLRRSKSLLRSVGRNSEVT